MTESKKALEKRRPRRGIYLLPNLFTTGCLFFGFYAVVSAIKGDYEQAAIAIFIAMIMDGLDGRVARLTNTSTEFGVQYDSLADMVSFGVAPALVMYLWALNGLGKLGWLAAFLYTAGAALRLARFNTQVDVVDKKFFQGLPSPAAAALVAGTVWMGMRYELEVQSIAYAALTITALSGLLMVSNMRYYSFKDIDLKGKVPFLATLLIVLLFVFISLDPPLVLFIGMMCYGLSGPIMTIILRQKRRMQRRQGEADNDKSSTKNH